MAGNSDSSQVENNNEEIEILVTVPTSESTSPTEDQAVSFRSTCLKSTLITLGVTGCSGLALFTTACLLSYAFTPYSGTGTQYPDQLSPNSLLAAGTGLALTGVSVFTAACVGGVAFFTRPKSSETQPLIDHQQPGAGPQTLNV